jgi:hypothetical protein
MPGGWGPGLNKQPPAFASRDTNDRVRRDPERSLAAEYCLRSALRHIGANASLRSLELFGVPCAVRPLCAALKADVAERQLRTLRLSQLRLDGARLAVLLDVLSGCCALSTVSLYDCHLSDADMPEVVNFVLAVKRRRMHLRGLRQLRDWPEMLRGGDAAATATAAAAHGSAASEARLDLELAANGFGDAGATLLADHLWDDDSLSTLDLRHKWARRP